MAFFTNNPLFQDYSLAGWEIRYIDSTAQQVLIAARDYIHIGWELTHHPLYGNFRPKHQPFRSILLSAPKSLQGLPTVDHTSVHLIEEALKVYASEQGIHPDAAPKSILRDCARIDLALIKTPLHQAGFPVQEWQEV